MSSYCRLCCLLTLLACAHLAPRAGAEAIRALMTDGTVLEAELVEEGSDFLLVRLSDGTQRRVRFTEIKRMLKPGEDPAAAGSGSKTPRPDTGEGGAAPEPPPAAPPDAGDDKPPPAASPTPPDEPAPAPKEDGKNDKPKQAYDPAVLEGPVTLDIKESIYKYCPTCDGHKDRECWYCTNGVRKYKDGTSETCSVCAGKGKLRCETCKGSGKMPDLFKVVPCRGCQRAMEFSLAPGLWACPLCGGYGMMKVENEGKGRKCVLCGGSGSFTCIICGGSAIAPRLFPASNRTPAAWRDRCKKGLAVLAACKLASDERVETVALTNASRDMPALAAMATVLQRHLDTMEKLDKQNLEGTREKGEILKKYAATALKSELHQERSLLELELGYLKPGH